MASATEAQAQGLGATRTKKRIGVVIVSMVVALALWVVIDPILGVELRSPATGSRASEEVTAAHVLIASGFTALLGWGSLALLERVATRARRIWAVVATLALILSLTGPLSGSGISAGNRTSLLLMHLAVGVILISGMLRTTSPPVGTKPGETGQ